MWNSVFRIRRRRQDRMVAEELPDDATLIMEARFDIRRDTA